VEIGVRLEGAPPGESVRDGTGVCTFFDGDGVLYRLKNRGEVPVDVTLLYVDSGFGITALYPEGKEPNRIEPGKTLDVPPVDVGGKTAGREYVVLIAVKSEARGRVDFTALAQPTVEGARDAARARGAVKERALDSPLGGLLRNALYKDSAARAAGRRQLDNFALELVTVEVQEGKRPRR
jgi:hypothetical protein